MLMPVMDWASWPSNFAARRVRIHPCHPCLQLPRQPAVSQPARHFPSIPTMHTPYVCMFSNATRSVAHAGCSLSLMPAYPITRAGCQAPPEPAEP